MVTWETGPCTCHSVTVASPRTPAPAVNRPSVCGAILLGAPEKAFVLSFHHLRCATDLVTPVQRKYQTFGQLPTQGSNSSFSRGSSSSIQNSHRTATAGRTTRPRSTLHYCRLGESTCDAWHCGPVCSWIHFASAKSFFSNGTNSIYSCKTFSLLSKHMHESLTFTFSLYWQIQFMVLCL